VDINTIFVFIYGKPRAAKMFVLIIDDDSEDRELFHEAIGVIDPAIRCASAKDGKEAVHKLTATMSQLPDFIFLDINMPVMNGRECLIELKKDLRLKHIPVVMYSTTSDTNEIRQCYTLGAHDFLVKPYNFKQLVEALRSIIVSGKRVAAR
jgi:CheY-like chemotaxis protein